MYILLLDMNFLHKNEKIKIIQKGRQMLKNISERCTESLISYNIIPYSKRNIYVYGFELFWSTAFRLSSILFLSFIFNYFLLAVTFILFFFPIRIPAGGYHAKNYRNCFYLTNFIALGCIFISRRLWVWKSEQVQYVLLFIMILSYIYIWGNAPVISAHYPVKKEQIIRNKRYTRILIVIEIIVLFVVTKSCNYCELYTAIITTFVVTIMMILSKKGGCKI